MVPGRSTHGRCYLCVSLTCIMGASPCFSVSSVETELEAFSEQIYFSKTSSEALPICSVVDFFLHL